MAGFGTAVNSVFEGDEPDARGKLVVFDPAVFKRTRSSLSDYDQARSEWDDIYSQFKSDWSAGEGAAKSRAGQEIGFLDKFYDGSYENFLSGLRAREADARRSAGDRALQFAQGATDRNALLRGGAGEGSASRAMALRFGKGVEDDIALSGIGRERADFDALTNAQRANMGLRTNIADALVKRQLLPHQLNDQELSMAIQQLAGIQGIRLGSAQPVFWNDRDRQERIMDSVDSAIDTSANLWSAYSGSGYTPSSAASQGTAGTYAGAPTVSGSTPYSAGMSYSAPPPSGGTTFNYSGMRPTVTSTGGYSAGMSYGGASPDVGSADWANLGGMSY